MGTCTRSVLFGTVWSFSPLYPQLFKSFEGEELEEISLASHWHCQTVTREAMGPTPLLSQRLDTELERVAEAEQQRLDERPEEAKSF